MTLPKWIKAEDVSKLICRKVQTLTNDRLKNRGIPYYKLGGSVRYLEADVLSFMESCKVDFKNKGK